MSVGLATSCAANAVNQSAGCGEAAASAVRGANELMNIQRCTVDDFLTIVSDLAAFWGSDRTRSIHHPMFVHEFGDTAFVVREGPTIVAYLFGFVSQTEPVGYVHLIAVRDGYRRQGLGQGLYAHFAEVVKLRGCIRLKAITTSSNALSIAFHRSLGMRIAGAKASDEVCVVTNYAGPGEDRVVFEQWIDALKKPGGMPV